MEDNNRSPLTRKSFLKKAGLGAAAFWTIPFSSVKAGKNQFVLEREYDLNRKYAVNDLVNIASIGVGGMGQSNTTRSLSVPGTKLVAACDLYDSRLLRCKEKYGDDIFTTRNYHEILDRDDVDAVIVSTSDHWHQRIAIDALNKGIGVYLEKPMVKDVSEGYDLIEAENNSSAPLLVGSQRTSSILYEKANELLVNGEIGDLNFVEAYWGRRSAMGAWNYSIPPSASPENVDWTRYREGLPTIPFNAEHFFRFRNFDDYGTGAAGDLFVHLFSGLHRVAESIGPNKIMATGGIRYWNDGRDAEDLVVGLFDYPESEKVPAFNLSVRVNFADGSGGGHVIRFTGSDGMIEIGGNSVTLVKASPMSQTGRSIDSFDESVREEYIAYQQSKFPPTRAQIIEPNEFIYSAPSGYSDHYDHHYSFIQAVRNGNSVLQDGAFGMRACAPALLSTDSMRENKIIDWNPVAMQLR